MSEQKKQWLLTITWDSIVNVNHSLCQAQKLEALLNAKTHAVARTRWESSAQKSMTLIESLDVCRRTFEQSPFTFNNGNTFAAIARSLVEDSLRNAPAVEAQILRSTISHFVAGTIDRKELAQVLTHMSPLLARTPSPVPVPVSPVANTHAPVAHAPIAASAPAPAPAPTPNQAPARPATEVAPRLSEARTLASS